MHNYHKYFSIFINVILLCLAIITLIPFIWMFTSSFAENSEIVKIGGTLFPKMTTLSNYVNVQKNFNFLRMFANSMFVSVTITAIIVYTSALAGFLFAKYQFKGKNILFGIVLSTMMLPGVVTLIPKYEMMLQFGWMNSYKALIIPSMVSAMGIFMFRQSISQIPNDMIEAAEMDGASDSYIFHKIILPMSKNTISTLIIFQFLWAWEDFIWPFLIIDDPDKQLIQVGLKLYSGQYGTDYGGLFAATTLTMFPVVIIYLIFQKRFISGITSGSIK